MNEIYWITRLDSLSDLFSFIMTLSFMWSVVFVIVKIACDSLVNDGRNIEFNKRWAKIAVNWIRFLIPTSIILGLLLVLIPTTKEAFLIYGVGGTIDYIKNDSVATQIPHKAIIALDKWVEELTNDEQNDRKN